MNIIIKRAPVMYNSSNLCSVNVKIVPRLKFEPICLHSDAADPLHLMCWCSQKSMESLRTLLHAKRSQKHTPETSRAPEKLGTILTLSLWIHILIQCNIRGCIKTCLKTPPNIKERIRVSEWRLVELTGAEKNYKIESKIRQIAKNRRAPQRRCGALWPVSGSASI